MPPVGTRLRHRRGRQIPALCGLLALALSVIHCACQGPADQRTRSGPARFLALGDSYTIGESVTEAERWPVVLVRELRARGVSIEPARILARTGWSTAQLATALDEADLEPPYDLVTLAIGVNDQFRNFAEASYSDRVRGLLERAIELAGGDPARVLMISIPDYGVTPFGMALGSERITAAIDLYNERNRAQAEQAGIVHIDITPISREAASEPALIASDGLHPSGKMYARWVEQILPLAERVLRGDTAPAP